ncbi:Dabb family protein [Mucilaginibacter limnophilus]|nr:Dabb family protein [Mucilaginibacter limnophilus]
MLLKNTLSHHVLFWLKNRGDLDLFIDGLHTLADIPSIRHYHVGKPAQTFDDVVDRTYDAGLLVLCDDVEALNAYHAHPIHDAFVEKYARPLVEKVVVHDAVNA